MLQKENVIFLIVFSFIVVGFLYTTREEVGVADDQGYV